MAELLKTPITRKELEEGIVPQNYVLCETYYTSLNARTKSGIIYGVNLDTLYADADNKHDTSSHPADMAEVSFKVYKLPERLYFNKDDVDKSMPWETEQELWEEDIVFTNIMEALNAITLTCDGKEYRLLPYQDLICAKREVWVDKWAGTKKTIVVMLNGYVLIEQMMLEATSSLDVTTAGKVDPTKGKIAYIGSRNTDYLMPDYCDIENMEGGDIAIFDKKYKPFLLERTLYSSRFDDKKLYNVIPRRRIVAVIKKK
jgi:hypothetical protein